LRQHKMIRSGFSDLSTLVKPEAIVAEIIL
jgi:hypothetical protein